MEPDLKVNDTNTPRCKLCQSVRGSLIDAFAVDAEILQLVGDHHIRDAFGMHALIDHIELIFTHAHTSHRKAEWIHDADIMRKAITDVALDELVDRFKDLPEEMRESVVNALTQTSDRKMPLKMTEAKRHEAEPVSKEAMGMEDGSDLIDFSISETAQTLPTGTVLPLPGAKTDDVIAGNLQ